MYCQTFGELSDMLASFVNYPDSAAIRPPRLANLGFYSNGQGEEVTCHGCDVSHTGFQLGENIQRTHLERSPNCPLTINANILHSDDVSASGNIGDNNPQDLPNSLPIARRPRETDVDDQTIPYYSFRLQRPIPFNRSEPDFGLLDSEGPPLRRFTFYDWPNREEEHEYCDQLVSQGLLYTGKLNYVQCCLCGVKFKASCLGSRQAICLPSCRRYF